MEQREQRPAPKAPAGAPVNLAACMGDKATQHRWKTESDPVMGGQSESKFEITEDNRKYWMASDPNNLDEFMWTWKQISTMIKTEFQNLNKVMINHFNTWIGRIL